jgi:hypothetical protein
MGVYSGNGPKVDDHYFNFKYAYLLTTDFTKATQDFDWIALTPEIESGHRYGVNLFNFSLIPFTYIDNWLVGLHIADAFYASCFLTLLYFVLRRASVRYPLFFAFASMSIFYFFDRILSGRSFVFVLALIFLQIYFAIEKKYKYLFFAVFFHILWHQNTYFMPVIIVILVELSRYIVERKIYIKNIVVTPLAIVVAMMFYPGFPGSVFGWMTNIFKIQHSSIAEQTPISGGELWPKNINEYIVDNVFLMLFLIFVIVASVIVFVDIYKHKKDYDVNKKYLIWICSLFLFILFCLCGSVFVSGRFFDFLIPAIFVSGAFLISILYKRINDKEDIFQKILKITMTSTLVILIWQNIFINFKEATKFDYEPAGKVAQWIEKESNNKREKVFLYNWSVFPLMFFENSNNVYSMGIEPNSLKSKDEELYWKYYNIFRNRYYCEQMRDCRDEYEKLNDDEKKENGRKIINSIKNDFGAKFIVSTSGLFTNILLQNLDLVDVYIAFTSDELSGEFVEYSVFKLK